MSGLGDNELLAELCASQQGAELLFNSNRDLLHRCWLENVRLYSASDDIGQPQKGADVIPPACARAVWNAHRPKQLRFFDYEAREDLDHEQQI